MRGSREAGVAFLYGEERVGVYMCSKTIKDERVKIKKFIQIQKIAARKNICINISKITF